MNLSYHCTPYIWPMLASAVFAAILGIYCWRHRTMPGALTFMFSYLLAGLASVGLAMTCLVVESDTKLF